MKHSESAAAVSADMDRIFVGVSRDPQLRAGQIQTRPDLTTADAEPVRDGKGLSILTRLVAPLVILVAMIVCTALAFDHYLQWSTSRLPAAHAVTAPQTRPEPATSRTPGVASPARVKDADRSRAATQLHDNQPAPADTRQTAVRKDRKGFERTTEHRSDRSADRQDCTSRNRQDCRSGGLREADARLRAAYINAIERGVNSRLLRETRRQWRKASRNYARHPRATIERYDALRQKLVERGHR